MAWEMMFTGRSAKCVCRTFAASLKMAMRSLSKGIGSLVAERKMWERRSSGQTEWSSQKDGVVMGWPSLEV